MRTGMLLGLLGLLAVSAPAHAARHELSFEYLGSFSPSSRVDDVFGDYASHGLGLRGGYAVLRDRSRLGLVVDAGWVHAARQARVQQYRYYDDYAPTDGDWSFSSEMATRWTADTFTVGLKGDVDVGNVWYPYVHAQAGLIAVGAHLADRGRPMSETDVRDSRVVPTGLFTLGFELMIPDQRLGWPVTAAIFLESGYQVSGKATFDTLGGPVPLSGALIRTGIGLRM